MEDKGQGLWSRIKLALFSCLQYDDKKGFPTVILAKHLALVALLSLIIWHAHKYYNVEGQSLAETWMKGLAPVIVQKLVVNKDTPKELRGNDLAVKRINTQIDKINGRITHHLDILKHFYSRYYMLIILATMTGIGAAFLLLIITKSGWANTSSYIITAFIVLAAFAITFTAFINIFSLEKNIADNKALYIQYIAMMDEVSSYITTGEDISGKKVELTKFIHNIDKKLASLNTLAIGFDATQIPDYKKIVKDLPQ